MNTEHCREFLVLAQHLNYSEAAKVLHVEQSTLSKHIAQLERDLGTPLFERDRHSVRLSDAGRLFVGSATEIVEACNRAERALASISGRRPIVVDGLLHDEALGGLLTMTMALLNAQPHDPINFGHYDNTPMDELFDEGKIDVLFFLHEKGSPHKDGVIIKRVLQTPFVAIVENDHPFAGRGQIHVEDLRDQTLVHYASEYFARGWSCIEAVCHNHGFEPRSHAFHGNIVSSLDIPPLNGDVLILQKNLRQIKFLEDSGTMSILSFADDDAVFVLHYAYKPEDEERLTPFLEALEEAQRAALSHRDRLWKNNGD